MCFHEKEPISLQCSKCNNDGFSLSAVEYAQPKGRMLQLRMVSCRAGSSFSILDKGDEEQRKKFRLFRSKIKYQRARRKAVSKALHVVDLQFSL